MCMYFYYYVCIYVCSYMCVHVLVVCCIGFAVCMYTHSSAEERPCQVLELKSINQSIIIFLTYIPDSYLAITISDY